MTELNKATNMEVSLVMDSERELRSRIVQMRKLVYISFGLGIASAIGLIIVVPTLCVIIGSHTSRIDHLATNEVLSHDNQELAKTTHRERDEQIIKLSTSEGLSAQTKVSTSQQPAESVDIMASCDALKKAGYRFNGVYLIDPDGPSTGLDPFSVVCDMTSDLTVGYTTIHHDKEEDGIVNNYETQGSFRVPVTYDLQSVQIQAIKDVSTSCRQFIKYACTHSTFNDGSQYWLSVDGKVMVNWGGVPTGIKACACWLTRSCDDVTKSCNCSVNDDVARMDQGYLTDKATLPVSEMRFGDTGSQNERGVYTLGPFQCA